MSEWFWLDGLQLLGLPLHLQNVLVHLWASVTLACREILDRSTNLYLQISSMWCCTYSPFLRWAGEWVEWYNFYKSEKVQGIYTKQQEELFYIKSQVKSSFFFVFYLFLGFYSFYKYARYITNFYMHKFTLHYSITQRKYHYTGLRE